MNSSIDRPAAEPSALEFHPWRWIAFAVLVRVIAARTQVSYGFPDEWFQTVEFGNGLAFGFQSQVQEFHLHLRNLTWPAILSLPLGLARWLSPDSVLLPFYLVKLLTGFLDLGILWGMSRMLAADKEMSRKVRRWSWIAFVLPWFLLAESVRPSMEHLSAIALWVGLGFLALQPSLTSRFLAGAAFALTGVFRYPSGLLGMGALIAAIIWPQVRKDRMDGDSRRMRIALLFGAVAGVSLGGVADWLYYGRPYESLWMYLQYNVLTDLASRNFGSQSVLVYWDYFTGFFKKPLGGLAAILLLASAQGTFRGLRKKEPWAFGLVFFLLGHAWISHKEPRFMAASQLLVIWGAIQGFCQWARAAVSVPKAFRVTGRVALWLLLIMNGVYLLRALWGDTFRTVSNYFEMDALQVAGPACAIVSVRRPAGASLPWENRGRVPDPAVGFFPAPAHRPSSESLANRPLIWVGRAPDSAECQRNPEVLLQVEQVEAFWERKAGCRLETAGIFRWLPSAQHKSFIERGWVSGPWYRCPASVLTFFQHSKIRQALVGRFERLPSHDIRDLATAAAAHDDGSFSDY